MDSFEWSDNYVTGLNDVDSQHKELVSLINKFGSLLTENKISFGDIKQTLQDLIDYSAFHFREEEGLMRSADIDTRHQDKHLDAHQSFLDEVCDLQAGITENNLIAARHLLDFLIHWLAFHILGVDQNLARQINAIQQGKSADEAYEQEEREQNKSTEPLLKALNGLFEQVSMRNKELQHLNQSLEEKVKERTRQLTVANRHLEELSLTDVLTKLPNRRHAMRQLAAVWKESIEENTPLVVMMIDADHFKEINDTYGHDAGDKVLIELAQTLNHSFRTDDIVCRLGGDEFFVIAPDTNLDGGLHAAEQTRKIVAELRVKTGGEAWNGSISVGVASKTPEMQNYEELIKAADRSVYASKEAGKNCVKTIQQISIHG